MSINELGGARGQHVQISVVRESRILPGKERRSV